MDADDKNELDEDDDEQQVGREEDTGGRAERALPSSEPAAS